jgi:hypothetical protein
MGQCEDDTEASWLMEEGEEGRKGREEGEGEGGKGRGEESHVIHDGADILANGYIEDATELSPPSFSETSLHLRDIFHKNFQLHLDQCI